MLVVSRYSIVYRLHSARVPGHPIVQSVDPVATTAADEDVEENEQPLISHEPLS